MTTETALDEKVKQRIKEPPKYKVVAFNDDYTPMEFVIALMVTIFNKDHPTAIHLTYQIHEQGKSVVGIYSHEVAEQKVSDGIKMARAHGHPLILKSEAE